MKKLAIIGLIISVVFTSCRRDIYPDAQFTVNYIEVQPDDDVVFSDRSVDAIEYNWDFGDGLSSDLRNPVHSYANEGDYTVTLTVTSVDGRTDMASLTIHVWYTILEITAAEWNPDEIIEYIVPGAWVALYESYSDWLNDVDEFDNIEPVVWGNTDDQGIVTFLGLNTQNYWVWVEADLDAGHYDNWDFKDYNPDYYLSTDVLTPFVYNYFTAWADFFPNKSLEKRSTKYKGQKIKADRHPLKDEEDVSK